MAGYLGIDVAKVALVACLRKRLTIVNAMLASGLRWHEQPA